MTTFTIEWKGYRGSFVTPDNIGPVAVWEMMSPEYIKTIEFENLEFRMEEDDVERQVMTILWLDDAGKVLTWCDFELDDPEMGDLIVYMVKGWEYE